MESGKRQKRVSEPNPLSVDGYDLIWEKRHPIFLDWRKELKGVSVSVWIRPGKPVCGCHPVARTNAVLSHNQSG